MFKVKYLVDHNKLINLEEPYPAFSGERRMGFSGNFEAIKQEYNYRCATCGSKEDKEHLFRKGIKVQLQEGHRHMNSTQPLEAGNIIPQCQFVTVPIVTVGFMIKQVE